MHVTTWIVIRHLLSSHPTHQIIYLKLKGKGLEKLGKLHKRTELQVTEVRLQTSVHLTFDVPSYGFYPSPRLLG